MYPSVAMVSCSGYQSALAAMIETVASELLQWQTLHGFSNYSAQSEYFLPNPTDRVHDLSNSAQIIVPPFLDCLPYIREIEENISLSSDFKMDDSSLLVKVRSKLADRELVKIKLEAEEEEGEGEGEGEGEVVRVKSRSTEEYQDRSTELAWEGTTKYTYMDAIMYGHMTDYKGRLNIANEMNIVSQERRREGGGTGDRESDRDKLCRADSDNGRDEGREGDISILLQELLSDLQSEYGMMVRQATSKKMRQSPPYLQLHLPPYRCTYRTVPYRTSFIPYKLTAHCIFLLY